jgi:dsRNA-specific ribonuclease
MSVLAKFFSTTTCAIVEEEGFVPADPFQPEMELYIYRTMEDVHSSYDFTCKNKPWEAHVHYHQFIDLVRDDIVGHIQNRFSYNEQLWGEDETKVSPFYKTLLSCRSCTSRLRSLLYPTSETLVQKIFRNYYPEDQEDFDFFVSAALADGDSVPEVFLALEVCEDNTRKEKKEFPKPEKSILISSLSAVPADKGIYQLRPKVKSFEKKFFLSCKDVESADRIWIGKGKNKENFLKMYNLLLEATSYIDKVVFGDDGIIFIRDYHHVRGEKDDKTDPPPLEEVGNRFKGTPFFDNTPLNVSLNFALPVGVRSTKDVPRIKCVQNIYGPVVVEKFLNDEEEKAPFFDLSKGSTIKDGGMGSFNPYGNGQTDFNTKLDQYHEELSNSVKAVLVLSDTFDDLYKHYKKEKLDFEERVLALNGQLDAQNRLNRDLNDLLKKEKEENLRLRSGVRSWLSSGPVLDTGDDDDLEDEVLSKVLPSNSSNSSNSSLVSPLKINVYDKDVKALLNAWCQKRQLPLPYYQHEISKTTSLDKFRCRAIVTANGKNMEGPFTQFFSIRIEAEQKAAELFIRSFDNHKLDNYNNYFAAKAINPSRDSLRSSGPDSPSIEWIPDPVDGFNYKTQLNEVCNSKGYAPIFATTRVGGPAHMPRFDSILTVDGIIEKGRGHDKKTAEQAAAKKVLQRLASRDF